MKCPNCEEENKENANYCTRCGKKFGDKNRFSLQGTKKISKEEEEVISEVLRTLQRITQNETVEELLKLGNNAYNNEKYGVAIAYYNRILSKYPKEVRALINKGDALRKLGLFEESLEWYDKAIVLEPDKAEIWDKKGLALHNLLAYEDAIKCYTKALELKPTFKKAESHKKIALMEIEKLKIKQK
jgi:tetratricopeptide (TPR) repeat protein